MRNLAEHSGTFRALERGLAAALALNLFCTTAQAQDPRDRPPEKGGLTYELGMPPVYKGFAGFESQSFRTASENTELAAFLNLGVYKDLGSPVVGIAALSAEGYGGYRGNAIDGGARASFLMPNLHLGFGADWNATDHDVVGLFRIDFPIRRGGIFGRGTTLSLRWLPAREQTLSIGINAPLWGRNLGATRPKRDAVILDDREPRRMERLDVSDGLREELEQLRERALWVTRLTQPFAENSGADAAEAMAPTIESVRQHLAQIEQELPAQHGASAAIGLYHQALERAFSRALAGTDLPAGEITSEGQRISAAARRILTDEVLMPYNYLLGQRKKNDSLLGLCAVAQTEFGSWILRQPEIPESSVLNVWFVFQTLCDIAEETRSALRDRWEDSRFVWLPLQFGLSPEEHDTQAELDEIIARAVRAEFTPENRVWYVINEQFQWEVARSVKLAEDYHVLWIHDFRGRNAQGKPDELAFEHALNYLEALTERAKMYDDAGTLPMYLILLDQHYFEINKGRLWLRLLREPLDTTMSLPSGYELWEARLERAQENLRQAVEGSRLLRLGRSQYGEKWLKNLIKVHINITNPADPSFRSSHSIGVFPVPDGLMRDHRKIAFYDVTEEDPYRGVAMFTGMGIGEHYAGPNWEDRAIMIQGPGALAVKTAARGLLEAQGFEAEELPFPLRARERPETYAESIATVHAELPDWLDSRGRVLQLHSETGFHAKPINVAKAVLYSLMPEGSVLVVPDSLWQSYIYASLLAGSALRGCQVLIIAPTLETAPSAAAPTMARAQGLLGRVIVFSNAFEAELQERGGLLKVGLYAPRQGVGDIAGRFRQAVETRPRWERANSSLHPAVEEVAMQAGAFLDSLGYAEQYLLSDTTEVQPKLHLKANLLVSGPAWEKLRVRPELARILRLHIQYLADQGATPTNAGSAPDVRNYPSALVEEWLGLVETILQESRPEERERFIQYLTVGSANMDYRSMVMDAEVMILLSGWQSLQGLIDFMLLPGLCEWLETTEELDQYLPPPGGFTRSLAGLIKLSL